MKMKGRTPQQIEAIKAVWHKGMTASMIADAVDRGPWLGKKPTRNGIIGTFTRWQEELKPCYLTSGSHARSKVLKEEVKKQSEGQHQESKPQESKPRKNSRNLNTGYVATPNKRKGSVRFTDEVRGDYSLSDQALRKHLHEERMLARDRANISSPSYRFNPRKKMP